MVILMKIEFCNSSVSSCALIDRPVITSLKNIFCRKQQNNNMRNIG